MINNTRVNDLQSKLLEAMDIINAQALKSISFDKTIECIIEDDSYRSEGKYTVSDGMKSFIAYSNDTRLKNKDSVYVTIPQGNFEIQKMIIGKKAEEDANKPFVFNTPFETMFDMTDNVVAGNVKTGALIANALNKYGSDNYEYITIYDQSCNYYGFTRLGIKANFKAWIKTAIKGEYGLMVILTTSNPNLASGQKIDTQEFYYNFSNKNMYGNSYNFETDYEQQIVIPLEDIKGTITNIKINFYQKADFFDKFNEPLPCSQLGFATEQNTNIYIKDEDGDYVLAEDDTILEPNIFVQDVYLCLGYDISIFKTDMVEIYTQQSNTYKHSSKVDNNGIKQNKKEIKLRWVHINDGVPIDMTSTENENEIADIDYEVRWYRYKIGASAADSYCGVYWTRINGVTGFSYSFDPNIDLQQEKIKVIIICNSTTPYRSNELYFENEEELPPSQEAQHIINALTISVDDNTNGNYLIYGQDNSIKDTVYGKEIRSLSAYFDANSSGGEIEEQEVINSTESENLIWTFPANNTMLELLNENKEEIVQGVGDDEKLLCYQVRTHAPLYRISSYYSPNKLNNTVTCQYTLNGRVYKTEKEFTFGPAGTMGYDQTLVIDFLGDANSVNLMDTGNETVFFQVQLYDHQNVSQIIPNGTVKWCWYYNSKLEMENPDVKFPYDLAESEFGQDSVLMLAKETFNIEHLYILQCTVGNLTTYFPIPIQRGDYSFIKGPTQVIYQSSGEPSYNREAYYLHTEAEGPQEDIKWKIIHHISAKDEKELEQKERFIGSLDPDTNKLLPLGIYTKDAPIYGVQAYDEATDASGQSKIVPLWTQPILILQNQWPNGVINAWDGKSLVLDEENSLVLARAMSAGKKNEDNTFSGVMIGDWAHTDTEESIANQTGVYGFHHGAMSYAFKEDGTAFLGKDGRGRIHIDGNDATIYSTDWTVQGMMIDLNDPYIQLNGTYNDQNTGLTERGSVKLSAKPNTQYPLEIGSKFKVKWDGTIYAKNGSFSGHIEADSGTIGNWEIVDGNLQSNDEKIVLSTEGTGTILINEDDIVIRGSYYDSKLGKSIPTQMTLSNNSIIHGGIIKAGTLQSNSKDDRINLDGYLTVGSYGHLGYIESGIPGSGHKSGIGMDYIKGDTTYGEIKVTEVNSGLNFGDCYISISENGITMGNSESDKILDFRDFGAEQQHGIYARFA